MNPTTTPTLFPLPEPKQRIDKHTARKKNTDFRNSKIDKKYNELYAQGLRDEIIYDEIHDIWGLSINTIKGIVHGWNKGRRDK